MPRVPMSSRLWLWLLLMALGAAFLVNLGAWGVLESSEARYAEMGREMLATGDWLHPRLLGIQHFHKPPLTYWLTAAGLALFGGGAGAVRLLPVLAVLAQVALVYGLGQLLFEGDNRRALAAAVIYATFPAVLVSALNLTTDAYLATWELLATYAILRYYQAGKAGWLYLCWLSLGLAFLTKGPVGAVLPLMAVVGFYFRQRQARRPFTVHHLLAAGLGLVVGVGWYAFLVAENPAFLRYFLFNQTVERFATTTFKRQAPWWFYLVLVPATSLPWSLMLLVQMVRTRWREVPQRWRNVLLFWIVMPLVFFSLSKSKLLLYVLPLFAGLALLTVHYLSRLTDALLYRWHVGLVALYGLVLAALCLLPVLTVALSLPLTAAPATSAWPAVGIVVLVLVQALWTEVRVAPKLLTVAVLFTVTLLLTLKPLLRQNEGSLRSSRPLAEVLQTHNLQNRPVLVFDQLLPSLAFETGRQPISLYFDNDDLKRETQFEPDSTWRQNLISLQEENDPEQDQYLLQLLEQKPVLLVKNKIRPESEWMLRYFPQHEHVGDWTVYYSGW
ncbi:glycosyltransferase family 39 protein [Hymenobacter sp. BT175]|uniref:ArnT family glycosyltransferase n=1 Tax=Hymenobacter translucens TaxID=2886507 RepID=UPI001D0E77DB|nr:glycosyltransferase family 39 protein [Hymenobacter translucens]MCC2545434.1 glycosyltransferase family 39 protein [Hymenobacter translucens]